MRGCTRGMLLLVLGSAACGGGKMAFDGAHRAALSDSVRTMLNAWTAALASREVNAISRFYSDSIDFRWIEDGQVRYTSRADITAAIRSMLPSLRAFELTLTEPEITPLRPGLAAVTSAFAQKMTDTSDAVSGVAGAISAVVVHGDSGWVFLLGHGSLLPPPPPDTTRHGRRS